MKITNFLALGICLLFGSCTMQKSTVQVNDKGTEWGWNKGTIVVKTPNDLPDKRVSSGWLFLRWK